MTTNLDSDLTEDTLIIADKIHNPNISYADIIHFFKNIKSYKDNDINSTSTIEDYSSKIKYPFNVQLVNSNGQPLQSGKSFKYGDLNKEKTTSSYLDFKNRYYIKIRNNRTPDDASFLFFIELPPRHMNRYREYVLRHNINYIEHKLREQLGSEYPQFVMPTEPLNSGEDLVENFIPYQDSLYFSILRQDGLDTHTHKPTQFSTCNITSDEQNKNCMNNPVSLLVKIKKCKKKLFIKYIYSFNKDNLFNSIQYDDPEEEPTGVKNSSGMYLPPSSESSSDKDEINLDDDDDEETFDVNPDFGGRRIKTTKKKTKRTRKNKNKKNKRSTVKKNKRSRTKRTRRMRR